ncbi:hypothetical protein T552_00464 [Pneumocystis carinii B80]|uniref:TMEM14 protein n=1 Tax=Pneumocystis carinii (strain B80) TaxID=1408658 RepID=A0A0W4ZQW4_PNEC8|nr:hypothetical protein T552_00464 [Pneumocystis carinii B80]KTW30752.1 hypothetical protein T552_00464 [Pneumocystis carinii B80]
MDPVSGILAISLYIGGSTGYLLKRSVPSFIAGTALGTMYGCSSVLLQYHQLSSYQLSLFTSSLLTTTSIIRLYKSGIKPVPTILGLLGFLTTGYYSKKLFY